MLGIQGRMIRGFMAVAIGGALLFGGAAYLFMSDVINTLSFTELNEITRGIHNMATLSYGINQERVDHGQAIFERILPGLGRLDEKRQRTITAIDQNSQAAVDLEIPSLYIGDREIFGADGVIDEISLYSGCAATVFQMIPQGMLRISTSLKDAKGKRAVGTYIPSSSPVYAAVSKGEVFHGRANVLGKPYIASYAPLKDGSGKIVGAVFSGIPQSELESLKAMLAEIKIGKSGYPYVIDSAGTLFIHPSRAGENIYSEKDAKGRYFIREICEKKEGTIVYPWPVAGKKEPQNKIVVYKYVAEMDWIVAAGAYLEDYYQPLYRLMYLLSGMLAFIALMSGVVAIFLSRSIAGAIRRYNKGLYDASMSLEGEAVSMASSSQELAAGTEELSSTVQEVTATMESLKDAVEVGARTMDEAEGLMRKANEDSRTSSAQMAELVEALGEIHARSKEVAKIVKVIDDIAFQTNILALNAAVEAARAGDSGKGFAVVAEQVKSLAQKSAEAANSTTEIISRALASAEKGKSLCSDVSASLGASAAMTEKSGILLIEAARSSREQSQSAREVSRSMGQVSSIVQGTASSSEETAATGETLQEQANSMREIVTGLNEVVNGRRGLKAAAKQEIARP
jgi:signal transduction histidine kinase